MFILGSPKDSLYGYDKEYGMYLLSTGKNKRNKRKAKRLKKQFN